MIKVVDGVTGKTKSPISMVSLEINCSCSCGVSASIFVSELRGLEGREFKGYNYLRVLVRLYESYRVLKEVTCTKRKIDALGLSCSFCHFCT